MDPKIKSLAEMKSLTVRLRGAIRPPLVKI
jgi:hypothetical protein